METAVARAHGDPVHDDGNIRSGAAHVHDDCVLLVGQPEPAHHARRGTAKQRFHGMQACELLAHQAAVAAHDDHGRGKPARLHHLFDGADKIADDGIQLRV